MISPSGGLVRIPSLNQKSLLQLAQSEDLDKEEGLLFAFVNKAEHFKAFLMEQAPEKVIYFNKDVQKVDPLEEKAIGFIMGGFSRGIQTLLITDLEEQAIVSDILFSDGESISVSHIEWP